MIRKASISWTAKQVSKSIAKGTITFENEIQRCLAWDVKRKSLLIHSMIVGFPMGPIFAAKGENGYDVLDGKQRLNTIHEFMNGGFALTDIPDEMEVEMDYGMDIVDLNGYKWDELPESIKEIIQDYSITVYYFDGLTDEEMNEMFFRLNNGKALSAIELTRVKTKSISTVRELAQHELFSSSMTKAAMAKYANEDIVMKSYVLLQEEVSDLSTKTVRQIMETTEWTDEDINKLKQIYDMLFAIYNAIEDKKVKKKVVTRIHLLSLVPVANDVINGGFITQDEFKKWIEHFFTTENKEASVSEIYNKYVGSGSARKEAVEARYTEMIKNLEEFVEVKAA